MALGKAEPAERPALLHEAMNAPLYVCSANAITEDGLMVQIDLARLGNCIGAMCYGPGTVYVPIGRNKTVSGGYAQAVKRIKEVACPQNARRRLHSHVPKRALQSRPVRGIRCASRWRLTTLPRERAGRAPTGKRTQVILINESLSGY